MVSLIRKLFYRANSNSLIGSIYTLYLNALGLTSKSKVPSSTTFMWPHKVKIGRSCTIEKCVLFKYDGPYSDGKAIVIGDETFIGTGVEFNIKDSIFVGDKCLIASGCRFVDHDHGLLKELPMKDQKCLIGKIVIKDDVWIGANVVVLKGVVIETGAVIAAGAIVNKSIPAYEVWGGVPAKKIGNR